MVQFSVVKCAEKSYEWSYSENVGEIMEVLTWKIESILFQAVNAPRAKSRAARACIVEKKKFC